MERSAEHAWILEWTALHLSRHHDLTSARNIPSAHCCLLLQWEFNKTLS